MPERDFFVYCTSLKRPELRAIGELSWVRHLVEGEVLYRPGDPGNALFIVNKGCLELMPAKGSLRSQPLPLARGEVVGDIEAFSGLTRQGLVKAREGTSVQCFPRANFHELVRQVPSFFQYLCEQMAFRVVQANDLSRDHEHRTPLSGRISHFDLTTVHQTIASSGQTGELSIKDEQADKIGVFYFDAGRPCAATFQHLTGEEAFWQLFLTEGLAGTFSFLVDEKPVSEAMESGSITRSSDDMLIAALQFRDEFAAIKQEIPLSSARISPLGSEFRWNGDRQELVPAAKRIWDLLCRGPATLRELYRQGSVCELKVYQVISEFLSHERVAFS